MRGYDIEARNVPDPADPTKRVRRVIVKKGGAELGDFASWKQAEEFIQSAAKEPSEDPTK